MIEGAQPGDRDVPLRTSEEILALCRRARAEQSSALAVELYQLTRRGLPPPLLKAANAAIYFVQMGEEKDADTSGQIESP